MESTERQGREAAVFRIFARAESARAVPIQGARCEDAAPRPRSGRLQDLRASGICASRFRSCAQE